MRLIVTEKNNSAKKIAEILGGSPKADKSYKVPFYTWSDADGDHMAIGLKGHVLNPAFPEGYSNWQKTDLHDLIDAELIKEPTDKNVVKAVRKVAKEADELVIATDFDREGELIGLEALQEILDANPSLGTRERGRRRHRAVKRARYSALTKEEIERAFAELDELSYPLAHAGAARQDIDLLWGATLTRAVSLATRRFGSNFLSVGRVQSPTLGLIVERELERRAHVAKPFWEVFAKFEHPDGAFEAHHATDKFWERGRGRRRGRGHQEPGRRQGGRLAPQHPQAAGPATTPPPSRPTPRAASASPPPPRCGSPRTSTWTGSSPTRAPTTRSTRPRCRSGSWSPRWCASPSSPPPKALLDGQLTPTRGKKETTDHPPIYPTQARPPRRARGPQAPRLRAGRAPLPRHLLGADDHRVDPRRHRGRLARPTSCAARSSSTPATPASTPTPARPTRRSRSSRRARSWRSTASPGSSTRRPSRRRGSPRAS